MTLESKTRVVSGWSYNNFDVFYPSYKLFIAKKPYICLSFLFIGYVQN